MKNKSFIKLIIVVFLCTYLLYILYDNRQVIINEITYINEKYFENNIKQVLVDNNYTKKAG